MPRIDNIKSKFQKKEYRAWDNNLLETLKMPQSKLEEENSVLPQESIAAKVKEEARSESEFNQGSNKVQLKPVQGSERAHSELNHSSDKALLAPNHSAVAVQTAGETRAQLGFSSSVDDIETQIRKLGGNEQKIFFYIIDICIAKEALSTGEMSAKNIISIANTTKNGMETALKRLMKKGLIYREKGKPGKNGLINLAISEEIKKHAIKTLRLNQSDQDIIRNLSSNRVHLNNQNRVLSEFDSSLYSSSKNKYITTALPEEWKKINISPLEEIGFSEQHLSDIFETNLCDVNVVQESINHFAFGYAEGKYKSYDNPLKVFIGRLRKGNPWFESNYESPKEKALKELFERKKAEKEKQEAWMKKIIDLEFPEWRKKLTEEEIKKIVPAETLKSNLAAPITAALRAFYVKNILTHKSEFENMLD